MALANVLWSGGFDSTYLIIQHLNNNDTVQPYFMRFAGNPLFDYEQQVQDSIRKKLKKSENLLSAILWNVDLMVSTTELVIQLQQYKKIGMRFRLPSQYSIFRICKDISGVTDNIELGVVMHDKAHTYLNYKQSTDVDFFNGFTLPIIGYTKIQLWNNLTTDDQKILQNTVSCRKISADHKKCKERGIANIKQCDCCNGEEFLNLGECDG